jgi:hypothetical protein
VRVRRALAAAIAGGAIARVSAEAAAERVLALRAHLPSTHR